MFGFRSDKILNLSFIKIQIYLVVIRPTHTRTEGSAPARGSEFTTKATTLPGGGDSTEFALMLQAQLSDNYILENLT
jgi:hypothetical protein